jgi:CRISPR-associated endonuclease/helicase Cas3
MPPLFPVRSSESAPEPSEYFEEHASRVADLASEFLAPLGLEKTGRVLGISHDIGKLGDLFQEYISACIKSVGSKAPGHRHHGPDHSSAGSFYLVDKKGNALSALAWVSASHHGGLRSGADFRNRLINKREDKKIFSDMQNAIDRFSAEFENDLLPAHVLEEASAELAHWKERFAPDGNRSAGTLDILLRMLLSALADADALDAERAGNPQKSILRASAGSSIHELYELLVADQARLAHGKTGPVNEVRREVYEACLDKADGPVGVYRLCVPTGGGKTRSAMAFALKHALHHGMDRVITAIPYTSIVEQNVEVYRSIFGSENVLEHHSGAGVKDPETATSEDVRLALASENWDLPIVVTTNVQLLESLMGNRPGRCRKLHRIANSVVILDEVQTLPQKYMDTIIDVLHLLSKHFNTTIVLCSATQPALEEFSVRFSGFPKGSVHDIIDAPSRLFRKLARVRYSRMKDLAPVSLSEVMDEAMVHPRSLVVFNTKKDALQAAEYARETAEARGIDPGAVFMLSTVLCGAHRSKVLAEVRERLGKGLPCLLVSTQVVEAGVDLDFPFVMRAVGPLDRIIQVGGRCNREGKLDGLGEVVLFCLEDGMAPRGEYQVGTDGATTLLRLYPNPEDLEAQRQYFQLLREGVEQDSLKIQEDRNPSHLRFDDIAEKFHLIDEERFEVLVPYDETAQALISKARNGTSPARALLRKMQPYVVNMSRHAYQEALDAGLIVPIAPDFPVAEWCGQYDTEILGLVRKPRYLGPI